MLFKCGNKKSIFNKKFYNSFRNMISDDKLYFYTIDENINNLYIDLSNETLYYNLNIKGTHFNYECNNLKKNIFKSNKNKLILYGKFESDNLKFKLSILKNKNKYLFNPDIVGFSVFILYQYTNKIHWKKYFIKKYICKKR